MDAAKSSLEFFSADNRRFSGQKRQDVVAAGVDQLALMPLDNPGCDAHAKFVTASEIAACSAGPTGRRAQMIAGANMMEILGHSRVDCLPQRRIPFAAKPLPNLISVPGQHCEKAGGQS